MKRFTSPLLAVASAVLIASAAAAARPRYGGTLHVETRASLRTLDPSAAPIDPSDATARTRLLPLVFETLVAPDPAGGLRPLLAASWARDAQATSWRFTLRPGVKLHDGTLLEPAQAATALRATSDAWRVSSTADAIVIMSDRALPDLPWELVDARHAIAVRRATELVGTGPFRVDRLEPSRLSLRAHDDYWGSRAFVDAVQIDMGVGPADQLSHLEVGRADIVGVEAPDLGRLLQRGLRAVESRPLELLALVFDVNRGAAPSEAMRRALTLAVDRSAICTTLLQRHGQPAPALLPQWLSGYAALFASGYDRAQARALVAALPAAQRTLTLRVDPADSLARAVGERIAVDARDAGLAIKIEAPAALAPRPDARLLRVRLEANSPERALGVAVAVLNSRVTGLVPLEALPPAGAPLADVYRLERSLIGQHAVIPIVHVPELYGASARVRSWNSPVILPTGAWDLANVWLPDKP